MRRPLRLVLLFTALALSAVGGWWYFAHPSTLSRLASFRIGQAATLEEAKREIVAIEARTDAERELRELMSGWRTGNAAFDRYLATYVSDRQSSERLRRAFSLELSWRPEVLGDWAHFWAWRAKQSPPEEIASIASYLEAIAADAPRKLTWREVLELQAAFTLTHHADLARRLTPDNWSERYRQWRASKPDFSSVGRPEQPLE